MAGESTSTFDGAVTNLNGIAKLSGGVWSGLPNNGLNGIETALAVNGSDLYVGGTLTQTFDGAVLLNNIARFSGGVWSPLPNNGLNAQVNALAVSGSGDLYAGGIFTATRDFMVTNLFRIARFSSAAAQTFTVGGSVSGLTGNGLVLRNNGGDDLTIGANGPFTFATALANGSAYSVTVRTQPNGQTCSVTNGTGTVSGANVTSVAVACAAPQNTPTGVDVTVTVLGITITFDNVLGVGNTTVTPLLPPNPIIPQLPPGFVLFNNLAFDISTTATVTGPIIVTFDLGRLQPTPPPITPQVFAGLRVLHGEGGVLTDRTQPGPPPIIPSPPPIMPIFAKVSSLSPFVIAQLSSSTSTSTTTQAPATTTTTTLAGCTGVPDGPTFASIICRLEALLARVNAEPGLGDFQPKLAHTLTKGHDRAVEARDLCAASNAKKSKTRLKQVEHAVIQYAHRLSGLPARKKLDEALRQAFLAPAEPLRADTKMLRRAVTCPADAAT